MNEASDFSNLSKVRALSAGKSKTLYETADNEALIIDFRDDATAFNGVKHERLADKGHVNNLINARLMTELEGHHIDTHFTGLYSDHESVVKRLTMIPLESIVRNYAAGSLCRRLGLPKGQALTPPLYEVFLKNDSLGDPLITPEHAIYFKWATEEQLAGMRALTLKINTILQACFDQAGLILADAKFEFGINATGKLCLGDEVTPDSCRIWVKDTLEPLDKDRFRQDLGEVIPSYWKIAERLGIQKTSNSRS